MGLHVKSRGLNQWGPLIEQEAVALRGVGQEAGIATAKQAVAAAGDG